MSKTVARQWLEKQANPEFRIKVFNPNAKLKLAGVEPVPDLGIKEDFGGFYVWSSDQKAMQTLQKFFERRGLETSWIW